MLEAAAEGTLQRMLNTGWRQRSPQLIELSKLIRHWILG